MGSEKHTWRFPLRYPEVTTAVGAKAFNKPVVTKFFKHFKEYKLFKEVLKNTTKHFTEFTMNLRLQFRLCLGETQQF